MLGVADAVQHRVAHIEVGGGHVDFGAQDVLTVGKLAGPHPAEQVQVFFGGAVAPGTFPSRLRQSAPVLADFVGGETVHVGVAVQDELLGVPVELLKVVRGVVQVLAPVEAQPLDVGQDGFYVLDVLPRGVGVVEAHMAAGAVVLLAHAKVEADGLGVPDVQVSVGFGRETGYHAAIVGSGGLVVVDDGADKIGGDVPGAVVFVNAHFSVA